MWKTAPWKKDMVLMGDFNVDILKYEDDANIADFLDKT